MFSTPTTEVSTNTVVIEPKPPIHKLNNTLYAHGLQTTHDTKYSTVDSLLEREKQYNKTESWNKLDKTAKIQKLHGFAEKYGKEHSLPAKEVKHLKAFFVECLDKAKLQKTKDVIYDKEAREIESIPALHFNTEKHNFTLRILDTKRVSTLKSLTPKRVSEKNTMPDNTA
jgi:hypothetical protein